MTGPRKKRQRRRPRIDLMDLPEDLLTSILKHLPFKRKCQAQAVCQAFKEILWKPSKDHLSGT